MDNSCMSFIKMSKAFRWKRFNSCACKLIVSSWWLLCPVSDFEVVREGDVFRHGEERRKRIFNGVGRKGGERIVAWRSTVKTKGVHHHCLYRLGLPPFLLFFSFFPVFPLGILSFRFSLCLLPSRGVLRRRERTSQGYSFRTLLFSLFLLFVYFPSPCVPPFRSFPGIFLLLCGPETTKRRVSVFVHDECDAGRVIVRCGLLWSFLDLFFFSFLFRFHLFVLLLLLPLLSHFRPSPLPPSRRSKHEIGHGATATR
mmetsp:Transcript_5582/g.12954  ORF Transcript_5582/g.12954 Transcript_5582/m.12954 type:complete len:255 (-) Transcript_5582:2188-2952(-)